MLKVFDQRKNKLSGTTLIEAMTVLFVFSIIAVTFYSVWSMGMKFIMESKNKMGATALLNERIEIMRNLPYSSVGNIDAPPFGNIPTTEDVIANNQTYTVSTRVSYEDDPLDGLYPDDEIPNDYKNVRVEISWPGPTGGTSSIFGLARSTPPSLETTDSNTGVLLIGVRGINGTASVSNSLVTINNDAVTPAIHNMEGYTDNSGNLMLMGLPESLGGYRITVSKADYETIETKSLEDSALIANNYIDNHASVVAGVMSSKTIYQDELADLKIRTEDYKGNIIPNVDYHIEGGRKLGTNTDEEFGNITDVYNFNQDDSTGISGENDYADKSPGNHYLSNIGLIAEHTLIGVDQIIDYDISTQLYTFSLLPTDNKMVKIIFAKNADPSILIHVLNSEDPPLPISGATVHVTNTLGYSEDRITGKDGVAFFPVSEDEFVAGDYEFTVSASEYQSKNETITVSQLTSKVVNLQLN